MNTRCGSSAPTRGASHTPSADVLPAIAQLLREIVEPNASSSPAATSCAYGSWNGGAPVNPEALYPSEMLSPRRPIFTGFDSINCCQVLGRDEPANRGAY